MSGPLRLEHVNITLPRGYANTLFVEVPMHEDARIVNTRKCTENTGHDIVITYSTRGPRNKSEAYFKIMRILFLFTDFAGDMPEHFVYLDTVVINMCDLDFTFDVLAGIVSKDEI